MNRQPAIRLEKVAVGLLVLLGIGLTGFSGCAGKTEDPASAETQAPMPVQTVEGQPEISVSTLRQQLGANSQAEFVKAGGRIIAARLMNSGVKDITPLKGLPLKYLDLTNLPISDLSPLQGMPLEELYLEGTQVQDLTPLQGMPLWLLRMEQVPVADLSPLAGMKLTQLNLFGTQVTEISLVADMPLEILWLTETAVSDLSPLKNVLLESLDVEGTPVSDLSPLQGKTSLIRLNIANSHVTDLTPLQGLPLERLIFTPAQITTGMEVVEAMSTLQQIGESFETLLPAQEFWARRAAENIPE